MTAPTGWVDNDGSSPPLPNSEVSAAKLNALGAVVNGKIDTATKNQPNGVAGLDSSGKVGTAQLPSYVDDVVEYANPAAFPATGEVGKIYIALNTGSQYRWSSGIGYVQIVGSPGSTDAVAEGTTNLYFTNARADARVVAGITGKLDTSAAPELIRDTIGTALVAGTNVTITPNDAGDTITVAASGGGGGGTTLTDDGTGLFTVSTGGAGTGLTDDGTGLFTMS